jgi:hypothetical protein
MGKIEGWFAEKIRRLTEYTIGALGPDIDVRDGIINEVQDKTIKYERFGRLPYSKISIYIFDNNESGGPFGALPFGGERLKKDVEDELAKRFPRPEVPSVGVTVCHPGDQVPPAVQNGLGIETLDDADTNYYVHTPRIDVTVARLHCEQGLVHEETEEVDILNLDPVYIGRGREVFVNNRRRRNHFAFLNPQDPNTESEEERLEGATREERTALKVIHRDHARIEREGHRYRIYPGHPSYNIRIERAQSQGGSVVDTQGRVLQDGDRILLLPDDHNARLQNSASIRVEMQTEEVEH